CSCAKPSPAVPLGKHRNPISPSRIMQFIVCDCGTELPFSERDLSAAAGKPFTCPICGRTRRLPLANVFTPADPRRRSATISRASRAIPWKVTTIAPTLVPPLLVWAGPADGLHFAGILTACVAGLLLLVRVVQRDSTSAQITAAVALLGGLALHDGQWFVK